MKNTYKYLITWSLQYLARENEEGKKTGLPIWHTAAKYMGATINNNK